MLSCNSNIYLCFCPRRHSGHPVDDIHFINDTLTLWPWCLKSPTKNDCVCFQQSCSFRSTAKIQHSSTLMALRQWRLHLGTSSEYQWIAFTKGQWCEKHEICIRTCIFPSVKHHGLFCRLMTRPWYQFSFREVDNNWRVVGDRFNYKIISATQKLLENAFENAVCEMAAICPGIWVNIALKPEPI